MRRFFYSVRFRIWGAFVAFTALTLVFLMCVQNFLTPAVYRMLKTQESVDAVNMIENCWYKDKSRLPAVVNELAVSRQMDILINLTKENVFYQKDASGSGQLLHSRVVAQNIIQKLKDAKTNMIFLDDTDELADSTLLASYIGDRENPDVYVFIYSYLEPIGTTMEIIKTIFLISANTVLIVACAFAIVLSSRIANPIVRVSKNAKKLITGQFNMTIRRNDYEEIAVLTRNLNQASKEISRTDELRKDLIANVSHDLRTPLTMIKAYAEMIRDLSGDNPEKRNAHLGVIIDETDRLTSLVSDLLSLSKTQSGTDQLSLETIDFSAHIRELVSRFNLLDEKKDYEIELQLEDGIFINADVQKIEQVVYNLINNAINYMGEDKKVTVRLYNVNKSEARFEVADRGIGIPEEQIPYLWDRYYKIDRSATHQRQVKGTGLGLSIVKGVLENHGFGYGVESKVGHGSTFWFSFPTSYPLIEAEEIE